MRKPDPLALASAVIALVLAALAVLAVALLISLGLWALVAVWSQILPL